MTLLLPLQQADPSFLSLGFLFQFLHWGVVLGQFLTWNHPSSSFSLYFNLNKWFSHRSRFFFMISSSKCGGLLFVVLCGVVWFPVFLRCLFDSYWKIDYSIKDLGVNVADPKVMDIPVTLILSYIFSGIMPLYAINLGCCEFVYSSFTFFAVLNDVIFRFEWMNIILFLYIKKKGRRFFKVNPTYQISL